MAPAAVERCEIDPSRVVIEVTERFGGRMSSAVKSLRLLRDAGLKLALDDVGAAGLRSGAARQRDAERRRRARRAPRAGVVGRARDSVVRRSCP
jgi:hypothetical protein